MKTVTAFNTISKQFTKRPNELLKLEFDINAGAAATIYVQVHDFPTPSDLAAGNTAPAAGSVPKKSWPFPAGAANGYKEFKNAEMAFSYGVFVCVSTTQGTLTIGTGNNKFDSVAVELANPDISGTTEVQQASTSIEQIWTKANGATHTYTLIRAVGVNTEATVMYLQLFSKDVADMQDPGEVPIKQWKLAATGDANGLDVVALDFGNVVNGQVNGLVVNSLTSAHVPSAGCCFALSQTSGFWTAATNTGMNVYAEYK